MVLCCCDCQSELWHPTTASRFLISEIESAFVSQQSSASAAWSACGTSSRQDHSGWAGIIEANEQVAFPPLPCDRHPTAGHPLPDLPPYGCVPARQPQWGPDRALPPGPSRSARPPFPVASAGCPHYFAGAVADADCPRTTCASRAGGAPAVTECGHPSYRPAHRTAVMRGRGAFGDVIMSDADLGDLRLISRNGPQRRSGAVRRLRPRVDGAGFGCRSSRSPR
jgi:hypothetical protein